MGQEMTSGREEDICCQPGSHWTRALLLHITRITRIIKITAVGAPLYIFVELWFCSLSQTTISGSCHVSFCPNPDSRSECDGST